MKTTSKKTNVRQKIADTVPELKPVRKGPGPGFTVTKADLESWGVRVATQITGATKLLQQQLKAMAKTLNQILAAAAAEDTHEDSTQTLLDGVRQQVTDALAGVDIPDEAQAKLDAVFAELETQNDKVSAALTGDNPPTTSP